MAHCVSSSTADRFADEIKKFLRALTTQEKYPFSTPELRAELPECVNPDDVFVNPVFTGWKPWRIFCGKNEVRYIYHDPNGPVFAPPRNWRHGISCRLGGSAPISSAPDL